MSVAVQSQRQPPRLDRDAISLLPLMYLGVKMLMSKPRTEAQIAARGARALKGSRVVTWLERGFGSALIFFGVKLLFARK